MAEVTLRFDPSVENDIRALRIYEGPTADGPWTQIERTTVVGTYPNYITQYTTENALRNDDWFSVTWENISGAESARSTPVQGNYSEIMASLNDINANLDGVVIKANIEDTMLLQISVARIIRGFLSRTFSRVTLLGWNKPGDTPDIVREVAAKLIASQFYFNKTATQSLEITDENFAQRMYNEAMEILKQIVSGEIEIEELPTTSDTTIADLDFFPRDDTDRAFTLNLRLD